MIGFERMRKFLTRLVTAIKTNSNQPDMIRNFRLHWTLLPLVFCCSNRTAAQISTEQNLPRIVITADPELDDNNSLIRFLLYSSDLTIEGLVYASSQFHWKGDGKGTKWFVPGREYDRFGLKLCPCESWRWAEGERFIHDIVDAYEKIYPVRIIHNYPPHEKFDIRTAFDRFSLFK